MQKDQICVISKNGKGSNEAGTSQPKADDPLNNLGVKDDEDVKMMLHGSSMMKVRAPRWQRKRMIKLLDDGITVWCESNKSSSKAKSQQSFTVTDVECVREGCQSEMLRNLAGSLQEEQCLTIVFKGGRKSLDLQCATKEEAQCWARGIHTLQGRVKNMTQKETLDQYPSAAQIIKKCDKSADGRLEHEEIELRLMLYFFPILESHSKASPYPLILSLENHWSVEQQTILAQQLRSILGDKLLTKPLNDKPLECLPSPESPELSDLVLYTCGVSFQGFNQSAKNPPNEMNSFSESGASKLIKESGIVCECMFGRVGLTTILNSSCLPLSLPAPLVPLSFAPTSLVILISCFPGSRPYAYLDHSPSGFSPLYLRLLFKNKSSFDLHCDCLVLWVCERVTLVSVCNLLTTTLKTCGTLAVSWVISAQQLPKPDKEKLRSIVDPLVWVETYGAPIDTNKKKTHHIDNNGFNPRWDCTFKFILHVPELVLVRFKVEDHDFTTRNDFLGQFTLPLTSMRTGYRHVRLLKADGSSMTPSSLFIHVNLSPGDCSPARQTTTHTA
uniref:1-phosphatidylinositol 4,5-bisphosphate phosphodiesterase delta-3-A-like n=1 Tax=Xyrauchen texanus TaxID=154827 RepID=UPI002242AB8F|nr:1-phosphatidylinositol 4,5-bisphosphate phosphodiesterase delta-3-A-like [Xyrauchen texanus]